MFPPDLCSCRKEELLVRVEADPLRKRHQAAYVVSRISDRSAGGGAAVLRCCGRVAVLDFVRLLQRLGGADAEEEESSRDKGK